MYICMPLSSYPGMTINSFAMTLRGEGGGSPGLNVIMMLNSFLEVSPNTVLIIINSFPVAYALTEL